MKWVDLQNNKILTDPVYYNVQKILCLSLTVVKCLRFFQKTYLLHVLYVFLLSIE